MRRNMSWSCLGLILLGRLCWCQLEKPHVPQYMLDLYQGKTGPLEHYDTVRSYRNVYGGYYSDYGKYSLGANERIHVLGFNMSYKPTNEIIQLSELRLYTKVHLDEKNNFGVERQVSIYDSSNNQNIKMVTTRHLLEFSNTWESFNVTEAVLEFLNTSSNELFLEVRIDGIKGGDMDFSVVPYEDAEPLLVVYSRVSDSFVKDELLSRIKRSLQYHRIKKRSEDEEEEELTNYISGDPNRMKSKKGKVRRRKNPCRRKPMEVDFDRINFDTWLIAPRQYEAFECTGKCFNPISSHLTPTKHAVIQTLMHEVDPKAISRACCVPTKLGPISMLYHGRDGTLTYNYNFEDMVVLECGCR